MGIYNERENFYNKIILDVDSFCRTCAYFKYRAFRFFNRFIVPTRNIISFIGSFVLGYISSNGKKISYVKPHIIVLIQLLVGAIVLYPFANFSVLINFRVKELTYLFILGFVHSCITYILMYSSYHRLSAVSIAILTFIYPAIAILVDFYFYGKILNLYQWIGFFLIMFSGFSANKNLGSKWFERKAKIG